MASKCNGDDRDSSRKSSVAENNSSDGSFKENQSSESHLFGRMSKKLAQMTRFSRPDQTPASDTTKTNKRQQIENLERRLDEAERIRERLENEWKHRDAETRGLLAGEKASTHELLDKTATLEAALDEHGRHLERLRNEHRREMDNATTEWRNLEAAYRRQIDDLSVECAQAVSELTRLREQQQPSKTTTITDKDTERDVTTDPEHANMKEEVELDVNVEDNRGMMEQVENLQSQLDDANNSLVTLAITLSELREEHDDEQRRLSDVQQEAQKFSDENGRLMEILNVQKNRIGKLEAEKTNAEELVKELSHAMDKFKRKMETLEGRLQSAESIKARLESKNIDEIDALRKNLEEVLEAKKSIEVKYNFLRNCNAQQEQQLLDDYEWKLREIERGCKNQTEKLKEVQSKLMEEKDKIATEKTSQASEIQRREEKIVVTEAELRQLRGFSSELQKGMKSASTQVDQMRLLELRLRGELRDAKTQLQETRDVVSKLQTELEETKADADRRLRAKEVTLKYGHDERLKELAVEWDKRLKEESVKLKNNLEAQYAQQKIQDLQELSLQKDEEMADVIRDYEQSIQRLNNEASNMASKLENTEKHLTDEIHLVKMASNAKTKELQRRLDVQQSDCQKKDVDLRAKEKQLEDVQMQLAAHRATLDLVRVEAGRSKDDEIELLRAEQERQLERVTHEYEDQLQEALEIQLKSHKAQIQMARIELEKTIELATQKQKDQHECIGELKEALNAREEVIDRLNEEVKRLQTGLSKMSTELDFHGREILRVRHEASRQLRAVATAVESDPSPDSSRDRRTEDIIAIRQLREALLDKERLVKKLQEEKRTLQTELSHKMAHYKRLSISQPVVGANSESMSVPKLRNKRFKDSSKRLSAPILGSPLMDDFYEEAVADGSRRQANKHKSQKRK